MFDVDDNVPMPTKGAPGWKKYPFAEMEVGHSFFAPLPSTMLSNASINWGKAHGRRFSVRKVTENGVQGARVWRVE